MRYAILLLGLITLLLTGPSPVGAQQSGQGGGVFLGRALGAAGKLWVNEDYAIAAGVGVNLAGDNALHLHADYLIHDARVPQKLAFFRDLDGDGLVLAYYGAGARLRLFGGSRLGVRLPVGLLYAAGRGAWDAFLEVAPILDLVPDSDWDVGAFVGARWYFEIDSRRSAPPVF